LVFGGSPKNVTVSDLGSKGITESLSDAKHKIALYIFSLFFEINKKQLIGFSFFLKVIFKVFTKIFQNKVEVV